MAYIKNMHGKIYPVTGEEAAKLKIKRPHSADPDSGKIFKLGFQDATKEEYEDQLARDNESYKNIAKQDRKLALQSRGIIIETGGSDGVSASEMAELRKELKELRKAAAKREKQDKK